MSTIENTRPRLRPGLIVLPVIVTIANMSALVLGVSAWTEETNYGGDPGVLALLSVVVTGAALVGIAGAWLRRPWGPPLYFATAALGFLFVVFAASGAIILFTFVPLALAGRLWFLSR